MLPKAIKDSILKLRDEGMTVEEISRAMSLHYMTVYYQLRPGYRAKIAEYRKRWVKEHPHYQREYRRQHTGVTKEGRVVYGLNKKPRPEVCELCRRNSRRLHFHHWDDNMLELGIWLCVPCHRHAEALDKGVLELADDYMKLKDVASEEVEASRTVRVLGELLNRVQYLGRGNR